MHAGGLNYGVVLLVLFTNIAGCLTTVTVLEIGVYAVN